MSEITKAYRAYCCDYSDTQIYPKMALNSLGSTSSADETILWFPSQAEDSVLPPSALQGAGALRTPRCSEAGLARPHGHSATTPGTARPGQTPAPVWAVFKGDHWHFLKKLG